MPQYLPIFCLVFFLMFVDLYLIFGTPEAPPFKYNATNLPQNIPFNVESVSFTIDGTTFCLEIEENEGKHYLTFSRVKGGKVLHHNCTPYDNYKDSRSGLLVALLDNSHANIDNVKISTF